MALYAVLALVAPHVRVGSLIVPYEIFAAPPVLLVTLARTRQWLPRRASILLAIHLGVCVVATAAANASLGAAPDWIAMAGLLRGALQAVALASALTSVQLRAVAAAVILVNLGLTVVQVLFPASVALFDYLYFKESLVPIRLLREMGGFARATGSFGSPIDLGGLALTVLAAATAQLLLGRRSHLTVLVLGASLICGVASLSKTFLLGAPLVLGGLALTSIFLAKGDRRLASAGRFLFGLIPLGGVAALLVVNWMRGRGMPVDWYLGYFTRPTDALVTRYAAADGGLNAAMQVFRENWVLGVGFTRPSGEFLGDSLYVTVLHDAGVVGGALFFAYVLWLGVAALAGRDLERLGILVAFVIAGVAFPVFPNLLGALAIAFCERRSWEARHDQAPAAVRMRGATPVAASVGRASASAGELVRGTGHPPTGSARCQAAGGR
ncbi:MAG TPA: hypothetical protein VNK43_06445 [Gemmatimonadales bacterium]|nr:hypothetical protein [Gemmatimonadales bacterium]